tara:strand:+ start:1450 stop:1764 length:315 start_codon:yes stop_codon:yes gene_type:complete
MSWENILKISTKDAMSDARRFAPEDVREAEKEVQAAKRERLRPVLLNMIERYMSIEDPEGTRMMLSAIKQMLREYDLAPSLYGRFADKEANKKILLDWLGEESD